MSESAPTTIEPAAELRPGRRVQRGVTAGAVHAYEIDLAAGHYLHLTATPTATDLVLRLYGPDGELLVEQDDPWEEHGAEPVGVVAETAGRHRLEVRAATVAEGAEAGYELRAEPSRAATEEDRQRTAAEWALAAGNVHRRARRYDEALARFHEAQEAFRRLEDEAGATEALYGAARIQAELRDTAAAASLRQAASRFGAAGQSHRQVSALNRLATLRQLDGDLAAAAAVAEEARRLAEPLDDRPDLLATALIRLGESQHAIGANQAALDAFLAAAETAREGGLGDLFELTVQSRLGIVYADLHELDDASDHLGRAREIARRIESPEHEAVALGELGNVHYLAGRFDEAEAALEAALELHRQLGDEAWQASDLAHLGTLWMQRGDLDTARQRFEEALELARSTGHRREEGMMLHKLGRLCYEQGHLDESRQLHEQAARLLTDSSDRPAFTSARFGIARVLHDQGLYRDAHLVLMEILRDAELLRRSAEAPDLRAAWLDSKSHYWELHADVLVHLHQADPGGGHALLAMNAAEKGRARSLLDLLEEAQVDVRRGVDPELLEKEASIQRELNAADLRYREVFDDRTADPEVASRLEHEVDELRRELRRVGIEIRRTSDLFSDLDQLAGSGSPARADHIARLQREQLDADTLLLVYALGDERSFAWTVTKRSVDVHVLPPRQEIEATVDRFLQRLRSPAASDEPLRRRAGAELSAQVLGPLKALLTAERGFKRLAVVADGQLLHVPFAALPHPGAGASDHPMPLVEWFEVVHLPSATTLRALRKRTLGRPPRPKALAVLADPVFQTDDPRLGGRSAAPSGDGGIRSVRGAELDDLPRLVETRREAGAILSMVAGEDRLAAVGFDAAADPELLARLADYRVLHFATHALLDRRRPELSGLVLSRWDETGRPRDGLLRLHDIYDLRLPAELAVLSACETGLGRELRGEGLVGLTRGFMYAGTPRLVVSLWRVDDAATAALMSHFYANLLNERMRPPAALRLAQRSMRLSDRWSAPYYWAGFVFVGDWHLGFSLARTDLPIEQSDNGGGTDPPPPRTHDDLPLPGDEDPLFFSPARETAP